MTREQKYAQQMKALGIYDEAFAPEIHTLAIMEREHQRTLKAWKEAGSGTDSDIYAAVVQQRRDILSHRDALGLTPKAIHRMRPKHVQSADDDAPPTVLELVQAKHRKNA